MFAFSFVRNWKMRPPEFPVQSLALRELSWFCFSACFPNAKENNCARNTSFLRTHIWLFYCFTGSNKVRSQLFIFSKWPKVGGKIIIVWDEYDCLMFVPSLLSGVRTIGANNWKSSEDYHNNPIWSSSCLSIKMHFWLFAWARKSMAE